jgi:phenylalanyl-tRNA synthetase beta chain
MQMEVKQLRGLESNGMLCSAAELGAGEDADGIMILPDDPDLVPGQDVAELLGLNDWILELDLTANYAAHCQSMVGVAQEVAAILGTDADMPDTYTADQPNTDIHRLIGIDIQEPRCATGTSPGSSRA